jgi:hypothetical protein
MRGRSVFVALAIIVVGTVLLLGNLRLLPANTWPILWPVLLIALGIAMAWPRSSESAREKVSLSARGASSALVRIHHGAGKFVLVGDDLGDRLLTGEFGGGLAREVRQIGSQLRVNLRSAQLGSPFFMFPWEWNEHGLDWSLALNKQLPMSLDLHLGANEALIDLRELEITKLRLETGASKTDLYMSGASARTLASVHCGMAALTLHIPPHVAALIRVQSGLAAVKIDPDRFVRQGNTYRNATFECAAQQLELTLEAGMGAVEIV